MKKILQVGCIHLIMQLKHMLEDLEMVDKVYKMVAVNVED